MIEWAQVHDKSEHSVLTVTRLEFFGKGPGNTFLHKKGFPGESSTSGGGHRPPYLKN
jgi:hypothetical protein